LGSRGGKELEPRGVPEDAVFGQERDAEANRGCGDPAVAVVDVRGEGMTGAAAVIAELRADGDRQVVGLGDLELRDGALKV
jgi:hypothetical protein